MNITCMDYMYNAHDTGVPVEDVESLYVVVVSGDEIIRIIKKDGSEERFDAAQFEENWRCQDFFDGDYAVHKDDLKQWLNRGSSYAWFRVLVEQDEKKKEDPDVG